MRIQSIVPNPFPAHKWLTRNFSHRGNRFSTENNQFVSDRPTAKPRGSTTPKLMFEAGEKLILIHFGQSDVHACLAI
jgi:hypothetical protein